VVGLVDWARRPVVGLGVEDRGALQRLFLATSGTAALGGGRGDVCKKYFNLDKCAQLLYKMAGNDDSDYDSDVTTDDSDDAATARSFLLKMLGIVVVTGVVRAIKFNNTAAEEAVKNVLMLAFVGGPKRTLL
jgi:hypothetical protein